MSLGMVTAKKRGYRWGSTAPATTLNPMFVSKTPSTGEFSTYDRSAYCFFWYQSNTVTWTWQFESTFSQSPWPSVRALVDGVPATDWISPATNNYPFVFTCANGHHVISFEFQSNNPAFFVANNQQIARDFVVNTTGSPLPVQAPWSAVNRFERDTRGYLPSNWIQVTYPGAPVQPTIFPLKARTIEPYNTVLAKTALWGRKITHSTGENLHRMFCVLPTGDVAIELGQKYFYPTYTGAGVGLTAPIIPMRDGQRLTGMLGVVQKSIVRSSDVGYYMSDVQGRLCHMTTEGTIATIAGWRVIPGQLKAHSGLRHVNYMYGPSSGNSQPSHQTFYESKWEFLGDWSQVVGGGLPTRFQELRGFAVAKRRPDTTIDPREGREFWICDTLHSRILYVNARTMDGAGYEAAHFPPNGYTDPGAATGQAQLFRFGSGEGSQFFDECWDCCVSPFDGKLYWTNYNGGSICRANLDGTGVEKILQGVANPTNAQLGISGGARLGQSSTALATLRADRLIDGANGVASCCRPQCIGFMSDGSLVWGERYTYALRKMNLSTGLVSTLALMPVGTSTAFGLYDVSMCIDVEGTTGPIDDVYTDAYHFTDFRFSSTGTYRGHWKWTSGANMENGRMDMVTAPNYAFGPGVGNGRIITVGNAAGWHCVEITKKQPGDTVYAEATIEQGNEAHLLSDHTVTAAGGPAIAMYLGAEGQGELGFPTFEEMGSWTDGAIDAYGAARNVPAADAVAWRTFVRHCAVDNQY